MLETFLELFCESLFSSFVAFLMMSVASQKRRPFHDDFSRGNRQKSVGARPGTYGGCPSYVTLFFAKKFVTKTDRCAEALSWRGNQPLVLHFFGAFPSDRITMTTNGFSVRCFIYGNNSCKFYQRIRGDFWNYHVDDLMCWWCRWTNNTNKEALE